MRANFLFGTAAAVIALGIASTGFSQSNTSTTTAGSAAKPGASASSVDSGAGSVAPGSVSGTVGSSGSAAAGDTSASSIGLGAASRTPSQRSGSLSSGASASAPDGHARSGTRMHGRNAQSIGIARDNGDWSVSHTGTHLRQGELNSNTQTFAREPGAAPVRSKSRSSVDLKQ